MTISPVERRPNRRRGPGRALAWLLGLAAAAILFGAGVAVGEALHDNPKPGLTVTFVRTLHP
jgi:anti-sigma factor RsiW